MKKIKYTILGLLLFLNTSLSAWWDSGHMAVVQIAYEELQPEAKDKADAYMEAVSGPFPNYSDFIMASIWADDIIHDGIKSFFTWHGSARPFDPEGILSQQEHEKILASIKGNDIVWIIKECMKTLKDPKATPWAKGFMLRFLIHMVGDVHQPSHCITYYSRQFPEGDRAGTLFKIKHERYKSLHDMFDGAFGLGDRRPERPMSEEDKQYLDDLVSLLKERFPRDSFRQLGEQNIDKWRQESYDIGVHFAYANLSPNEPTTDQFMEEGKIITGRQLALAGYRLADLLNSVLGEAKE
ncbi:MAG: S1/P1 nuclease [bacterium]